MVRLAAAIAVLSVMWPGSASAQVGADMPMMRPPIYTYVAFDEIEFLATGPEEAIEFDGEMWVGGDVNRLWLKASGGRSTRGEAEGDVELQALYSRTTSSFWNAQAGMRLDHRNSEGSDTRALVAVGFEGLAPYWFEVESFVFVSLQGDVSARVEASYETLLTQRLIVESEVELNGAVQEVPEFGLGSGLNDIELGARARYEFKRELAPYVGYSWQRSLGDTADLIRAMSGVVSHGAFVVGLHVWY